jgi:radical SAM superfamily enzyme YgiQ (UPF0313 family)
MLNEQIASTYKGKVVELLDFMTNRILAHDPQWVCLSLLTYLSQITTRWLCFRLRQRAPDLKIVIGGPGAAVSLKSLDSYSVALQKEGLIDYYVVGDGEQSLISLIKGDVNYAGINSPRWQQLPTLNNQPLPDFDDYDWRLYDQKRVSIVGSRGCVRQCTFCDIHEHWNKFQWRTGKDIFDEIYHQKNRYNINVFQFADSLVNGNQKEYLSLITQLANYNQGKPDQDRIAWTGSFIVRPVEQMKEEVWKLTAESGAQMLSVGIESFVEHIRLHIKKKFSNKDIDFALDMAKKYNIKLSLLIIIGYVTETDQDFQAQLDWVTQHKHYANDPIHTVQIGSGLGILEGTWLHRNHKELNVEIGSTSVTQDWVRPDIGSTPKKRMQWHRKMHDHLINNGFLVGLYQDNHALIETYLNDKYSKANFS